MCRKYKAFPFALCGCGTQLQASWHAPGMASSYADDHANAIRLI